MAYHAHYGPSAADVQFSEGTNMELIHHMDIDQLMTLQVVFAKMNAEGKWFLPAWLELAIRTYHARTH